MHHVDKTKALKHNGQHEQAGQNRTRSGHSSPLRGHVDPRHYSPDGLQQDDGEQIGCRCGTCGGLVLGSCFSEPRLQKIADRRNLGICRRETKERPDYEGPYGAGDAWLWLATDADTKLVPCWHVGGRDGGAAMEFIDNLASRLAGRVQITTDGHKAYLDAIDTAFGGEVDYAMLVKLYGPAPEGQRRYSPAECTGAIKTPIQGHPDLKHVSTSYAERNNRNVRMHSRRMTRLTNAFSKKIENHAHAMALHFMYT